MRDSATDRPSWKGHRSRLRARFRRGPSMTPDYEFLEILLFHGIRQQDTKPLAKRLLERFETVQGVFDARADELLQVEGFGRGLLDFWLVLRELLARYAASHLRQRKVLASPEAVARMARRQLAGKSREECWLALLDAGNRLIAWEPLRHGSVDEVPVQPREVVALALERDAKGIIMVHNHPGGDPRPSGADTALTEHLQRLAGEMGLRFLDHVIITEGDCYSITQGIVI